MNLILSGRGVDLDDGLRGYATEKLTKVERFFDRIIKMEVHLDHERNPRVKSPERVEITVKTPGETLRVHGEGTDHRAAIDVAADRLEAQVRKIKDRLRRHSHRNGKTAEATEPVEDSAITRRAQQLAKPLTPEEARVELESRDLSFLLFTNAETMTAAVIYRTGDGGFGLIEHNA